MRRAALPILAVLALAALAAWTLSSPGRTGFRDEDLGGSWRESRDETGREGTRAGDGRGPSDAATAGPSAGSRRGRSEGGAAGERGESEPPAASDATARPGSGAGIAPEGSGSARSARPAAKAAEAPTHLPAGSGTGGRAVAVPGRIVGRVVRASDGRPVAGALVRIQGPGDPPKATTDDAGAFRLEVANGRWAIEVAAPELAREVVAGIEVPLSQETRVPDIVLSPHSVLLGTVIGADDRPRQGLRVRALGLNGGSAEATTDAQGAYRLTGLAAGNYFLEVKGGPADVYPTLVITLGKGEERRADFGPAEGARLVVTVTRDALPVPDAEVRLWSRAGTFGDVGLALADVRTETRHTDRDGRAEFEGLVPGPYDVGVQAWDVDAQGKRIGPTRAAWARAVLSAESAETRVAIAYPGGGLSGRVLEAGTLSPIGGVRVTVEAPAARTTRSIADKLVSGVTVFAGTDGDGRFSVPHLSPGDYTVSLVKPGYEAALLEGVRVSESGLTPLETVLHLGGGVLAGTVSVEGARSVGGAFVLLRDPSGGDVGFQGIPADGAFRFEGLRPGPHALYLYVPNRPVLVREGIEVRAGETGTVDVEVPAAGG